MARRNSYPPNPPAEFFREWRRKVRNDFSQQPDVTFYQDGVVDPKSWEHLRKCGRPRVLVLLREVNWSGSVDGDLRVDLRNSDAPLGNTFKLAAYWIYASINGLPSWSALEALEPVDRALENLKRIYLKLGAVMNIKKVAGGARVDRAKYNSFLEAYADEIREEISLISPDIIICGGTYDDLSRLFPDLEIASKKIRGISHAHSTEYKWHVFGTLHPSQRTQDHPTMYDNLISAVREVCQAVNSPRSCNHCRILH